MFQKYLRKLGVGEMGNVIARKYSDQIEKS